MKKLLIAIWITGVIGGGSAAALADELKMDASEPTANATYQISGNWSELKRGWNTLVLKVADPTNQAVLGAQVTVTYDMVEMPMSPPEKPVEEKGDGIYEKRIFLGMKGTWLFNTVVNSNGEGDTLTRNQEVTR